ncbi:malonyl-CoA decarboxylase domain-containing protein [Aminobacter sp. HY435]|uniref:malonyl-CoA decarboxylase domain-containing protein n=1 Tax=Aminobacter sp. HY435 TaxID=2970917 RepID=UPI0022B9BB8F|nr:malonyl-CoA decarboxylase family protein [Aminobacter sp. HY435]
MFFADLMATLFERRSELHRASGTGSIAERIEALLSGEGEVSGIRLAGEILSRYQAMDDAAKRNFFAHLADHLDLDPDRLHAAVQAYRNDRSAETLNRLSREAEPRRQELLRRLNQAPGATAWLVRMRRDLLALIPQAPELGVIDADFRHLFSSWFNRGFLVLRQIDWNTPANILEKIIEYEAVHAINDWQELRRRMLPRDRRCFAFFHPAMPEEPLIFVEVALCRGIPNSVQDLLGEDRNPLHENEIDTAVFYSISNCQEGLRGISFGNLLIKQVVEELARDVPHLKTFVTLSPVPGLNRWLRKGSADRPELAALLARSQGCDPHAMAGDADLLRRHCAEYLLQAKRPEGLPYDSVARFHLANGASLHDVHPLADTSANGWAQSSTVMVNYLYDLPSVSRNSERYATAGTVSASRQVEQLLRKDRKRRRA